MPLLFFRFTLTINTACWADGGGLLFGCLVGGHCSVSPCHKSVCEFHSARHIHCWQQWGETRTMTAQFAFERGRSIHILHFFQPQKCQYKMFHLWRSQHKILQLDKWWCERPILLQVTHIMLATLQVVTILLKRGSLGIVYFSGRLHSFEAIPNLWNYCVERSVLKLLFFISAVVLFSVLPWRWRRRRRKRRMRLVSFSPLSLFLFHS